MNTKLTHAIAGRARIGSTAVALAALLVLSLFASTPASAADLGGITVGLSADTDRVDVAGETTFDVIVTDLDGDSGAFQAKVWLDDAAVGELVDGDRRGDPSPSVSDVVVAADGSAATFMAAQVDNAALPTSGGVGIATVTVRGVAVGSSDLTLTVQAISDATGHKYPLKAITGATLTVGGTQSSTGGQSGGSSGSSGSGSSGGASGSDDSNGPDDSTEETDEPTSDGSDDDAPAAVGEDETTDSAGESVDADVDPADESNDAGADDDGQSPAGGQRTSVMSPGFGVFLALAALGVLTLLALVRRTN